MAFLENMAAHCSSIRMSFFGRVLFFFFKAQNSHNYCLA